MNRKSVLLFAAALCAVVSCTVMEDTEQQPITLADEPVFEGIIEEEEAGPEAKVYVDENLKVLWDRDDKVSIFNRLTYNRQYRFTGETGDNAGSFSPVPTEDFITGNELDYVYAVYPYRRSTTISNDGVLSVELPVDQTCGGGSFGRGDNTMIAVSEDNFLVFRNLCGYLMFKFYGAGLKVKSLSLKANGGEALAGKATVTMAPGGVPEAVIAAEGSSGTLTVNCDTPVALGSAEDDYTEFWFALPPVKMSKGFTVSVVLSDGSVFEKSNTNAVTITRNRRSHMSPVKVVPEGAPVPPADELWYTSTDGQIIEPTDATGLNATIVSNTYENGRGVIKFNGPLTNIGYDAFYNNTKLQSVVMSDAVTSLGGYAFGYCYYLESVRLSGQLQNISYNAFAYCEDLSGINIPESVQMIGSNAFYGCRVLSSVYLPESVSEVGTAAFGYCSALRGFYGKFASEDHRMLVVNGELNSFAPSGLSAYSIPEGIVSIGNSALRECSGLARITLPQSLEVIKSWAFGYCRALRSIQIPPAVSSIEYAAFCRCDNLQEFSGNYATADGRALIKDNVFLSFAPYGVTEYTIPEGVTEVDNYSFNYCNKLTSVSLPASLKRIGYDAFYSCSLLDSIRLPEGLTRIEGYAFAYCRKIKEMVIPASVSYMGAHVLSYDTALESVTLLPKTPPTAGSTMFYKCNTLPIYVPAVAVNAYKAANNWSTYADWIQPIPGDVFFEVSPEAVTLSCESQSFAVTVSTNQSYHADIPSTASWISAGSVSGSQDGGFQHLFNVSKNDGEERQAVISFCTDDGVCHPVTITQKKEDSSISEFDWNKSFYRRSLFMRFTATWCGYCPNMAKSVKMAQQELPDKIEAVNIHVGGSNLQFDKYSGLVNQYAITGYPSGILDGRRLVENYNNAYTVSLIKQYMEESGKNYPVSSTIGFDSYFFGNTLSLDLQLYLREAADYKVTVLLLESGIVGYQADNYDGSHQDYVHNDVARMVINDNVTGDSFSTTAGCAVKQLSYSVSVPSSYVKDNLRILVYVQRAFGSQSVLSTADYGGYYVDNCVSGKAGTKLAPAVVSEGGGSNEDFGHGNPVNW